MFLKSTLFSARQRAVGDGERLGALPVGDVGDAEDAAQLSGRYQLGAGRGRGARRRLRERGRARGVERHVAFNLLHDLVDVPVEHGHRSEAGQQGERLRRILGAPAPFRRNRPQRDMGEDHNRGLCALALQVVGEPGELVGSEIAHAASFEVDHVDEADEVHAVLVERVPAGAARVLAVALQVGLAGSLVDHVMLARNVVAVELELADRLGGIVELLGLRQMRDVARVNEEGGLRGQRRHLADRLFERRQRVRIGGLVETDVAVGNLQEGEPSVGRMRGPEQGRSRHAAGNSPQHAGARPEHAFERASAIHFHRSVIIVLAHRLLRMLASPQTTAITSLSPQRLGWPPGNSGLTPS